MTEIKRRTAQVVIYQGDYLDEIRHLERQHEAALRAEKTAGPRLMDEKPESVTLSEKHAALVAEAEETAITVTLAALGRKVWRKMIEDSPPREDVEGDTIIGANEDALKEELVPASIVEPEWLRESTDDLADIDFDRLYLTAFALNRAPAADPKALVVSQPNQKSDETSN